MVLSRSCRLLKWSDERLQSDALAPTHAGVEVMRGGRDPKHAAKDAIARVIVIPLPRLKDRSDRAGGLTHLWLPSRCRVRRRNDLRLHLDTPYYVLLTRPKNGGVFSRARSRRAAMCVRQGRSCRRA